MIFFLDASYERQVESLASRKAEQAFGVLWQARPAIGSSTVNAIVGVEGTFGRVRHSVRDVVGLDFKFLAQSPDLVPEADLGGVEDVMSEFYALSDDRIVEGPQFAPKGIKEKN